MYTYYLIESSGNIQEINRSKRMVLSELQKLVQSYIEAIPIKTFRDLKNPIMIRNEEGGLDSLPKNETATKFLEQYYILGIRGDVIVCESNSIQ